VTRAPRAKLSQNRRVRELATSCVQWDRPAAIACSGGVDSTALLVLSAAARERVPPFVVVYVDHVTRPDTAAEGRRVALLCADLELPCVRTSVVAEWAEGEHVAEHRLRQARLDALGRVVAGLGLDAAVTAHTLDDQVETVLMRILGGASPIGASGMQPDVTITTASGPLRVLRPLLGIAREELVAVLDAAGVVPSIDPSNADLRYRRNRLRQEIVPALARAFPGFPITLLRSVALARLDAEVVDAVAADVFDRIARTTDGGLAIDRADLRSAPRAVAARVVIAAALQTSTTMGSDSRDLTAERISAVVDAARGRTGALIQLPYGVDVRVERDVLLFVARGPGAE